MVQSVEVRYEISRKKKHFNGEFASSIPSSEGVVTKEFLSQRSIPLQLKQDGADDELIKLGQPTAFGILTILSGTDPV